MSNKVKALPAVREIVRLRQEKAGLDEVARANRKYCQLLVDKLTKTREPLSTGESPEEFIANLYQLSLALAGGKTQLAFFQRINAFSCYGAELEVGLRNNGSICTRIRNVAEASGLGTAFANRCKLLDRRAKIIFCAPKGYEKPLDDLPPQEARSLRYAVVVIDLNFEVLRSSADPLLPTEVGQRLFWALRQAAKNWPAN